MHCLRDVLSKIQDTKKSFLLAKDAAWLHTADAEAERLLLDIESMEKRFHFPADEDA
jgi:hypothetical protein